MSKTTKPKAVTPKAKTATKTAKTVTPKTKTVTPKTETPKPKLETLSPAQKKVNELNKRKEKGEIPAHEWNNHFYPHIERFEAGNREPSLIEKILSL